MFNFNKENKVADFTGHVVSILDGSTIRIKRVVNVKHETGKIIRKASFFMCQHNDKKLQIGEQVLVYKIRPISKTKHYFAEKKI